MAELQTKPPFQRANSGQIREQPRRIAPIMRRLCLVADLVTMLIGRRWS